MDIDTPVSRLLAFSAAEHEASADKRSAWMSNNDAARLFFFSNKAPAVVS